jgi:lysozyme family protein
MPRKEPSVIRTSRSDLIVMSDNGFGTALLFVLSWEGGLSDDPDDPGGRTYRGITQREYDAWRDNHALQRQDVAELDDNELRNIYELNYWEASHCAPLPLQLDLVQFDTAVNMGVVRATRFLQQAVGVLVDGVFGPITLEATRNADLSSLESSYCDARAQFYQTLVTRRPKLQKFLAGWLNRLDALRHQAGIAGAEPQMPSIPTRTAKVPDYGEDSSLD